MAGFFRRRREALWRVEQYRGQRSIEVQATQLDAHGVTKRSEQKRILAEWVEFLGESTTRITDLNLPVEYRRIYLTQPAGNISWNRSR